MEAVLTCDNWSRRVHVASGFRQRLTGLVGSDEDQAMLIPTRSVHGFGMRRSLVVVGIDRHHRVLGSRVLRPNRIVTFLTARYVLEMPPGCPVPPTGTKLSFHDV